MIRQRQHSLSRRLPLLLTGSGLCLLALVGCAGGGAQAESAMTTRPAQTSTSAATSPSSSPTTSAQTKTPAAASTPAAQQTPASTSAGATAASGRCDVGQLTASTTKDLHTNVDINIPITLKNTGSTACTLQGWPGVSFVAGASGKQIGNAGVLDRSTPHPTVTLQPGGRAHFTAAIRINQYDNATCAPRITEGLRVIPPGSTKALFVQAPGFEACSANVPSIIHIGAITAG